MCWLYFNPVPLQCTNSLISHYRKDNCNEFLYFSTWEDKIRQYGHKSKLHHIKDKFLKVTIYTKCYRLKCSKLFIGPCAGPITDQGKTAKNQFYLFLNHFLPYLKTLWSTQIINDIKTTTNSHYHLGKDSGASANWCQDHMCCIDLSIQEDCSYSNGIIYNLNNSSQKVNKHLIFLCLLLMPCLPLSTVLYF